MRGLIERATLAPSSHNTQPWRFRIGPAHVDLCADRTRALPVNDPDDRELTISCGCALMSLRVAAAGEGSATETALWPEPDDRDLLARVRVTRGEPVAAAEAALAPFLAERRTCRRAFVPGEVASDVCARLAEAASAEAAWLRPIRGLEARRTVADLVAEGDALQWRDPAWRRELAAWLRPRRDGDGLAVPFLMAPFARCAVRMVDMGARVGVRDRALVAASPLVAVLGTDADDPRAWLAAGQALQRVLLTACALGVQVSHLNQPVQVAALRPELQGLVGAGFAQVLLRFGHADVALSATPRRPVAAVITGAVDVP